MLQYQRVKRQESLRELGSARRFQSIAIVRIDQDGGAVQPYYGSVLAARDVARKIGLHPALAQHRCAEMSGRRRSERDRRSHVVESKRAERDSVRAEDERSRRLLGDVGKENGAANAFDTLSIEPHIVGAHDSVEGEVLETAREISSQLGAAVEGIELRAIGERGHECAQARQRVHHRREFQRAAVSSLEGKGAGRLCLQPCRVERERIDRGDAVAKVHSRHGRIDAESGQS